MKIISAYTTDFLYSNLAKNFSKNMEKFNLRYHLYPYDSKGDWFANVCEKPKIVLQALREFEEDVIWMDVDCEFTRYPDLEIPENCISGCWIKKLNKTNLWSAFMVFKYTETTVKVLEEWIEACKHYKGRADDTIFDFIKESLEEKYNFRCGELNKDYFRFDVQHFVPRPLVVQVRASSHTLRGLKGIRVMADGTFALPKKDKELIEYLDQRYERIEELRWRPYKRDIYHLFKHKYSGLTINIIGKGPSLDNITKESLSNNPTLCINDSINIIEALNPDCPLYCITQDQDAVRSYPKSIIFCSPSAFIKFHHLENAYSYNYKSLGVHGNTITVIVAIRIAFMLGARKLKFFAFDSMHGNYEYAKSIGYPSSRAGKPERFISHKDTILNELIGKDYEIIT